MITKKNNNRVNEHREREMYKIVCFIVGKVLGLKLNVTRFLYLFGPMYDIVLSPMTSSSSNLYIFLLQLFFFRYRIVFLSCKNYCEHCNSIYTTIFKPKFSNQIVRTNSRQLIMRLNRITVFSYLSLRHQTFHELYFVIVKRSMPNWDS